MECIRKKEDRANAQAAVMAANVYRARMNTGIAGARVHDLHIGQRRDGETRSAKDLFTLFRKLTQRAQCL